MVPDLLLLTFELIDFLNLLCNFIEMIEIYACTTNQNSWQVWDI